MLTKDNAEAMVNSEVSRCKSEIDLQTSNQSDEFSGHKSGNGKSMNSGKSMYTREKSKDSAGY